MSKDTMAILEDLLNSSTKDLSKVTAKKMFGCHAVWANENVFALVWKHGRIGVKLPSEASYDTLMAVSGAEPWKAGPMKMAHWVLVPESFHGKPALIKKWAAVAHEQCSKLEKKTKKPAAKRKVK